MNKIVLVWQSFQLVKTQRVSKDKLYVHNQGFHMIWSESWWWDRFGICNIGTLVPLSFRSPSGLDNFGPNVVQYFSLKLLLKSVIIIIIVVIIIIITILTTTTTVYCLVQYFCFMEFYFTWKKCLPKTWLSKG